MNDHERTRASRRPSIGTRSLALVAGVVPAVACSTIAYVGRGRRLIEVTPGGGYFDDRILPVVLIMFLVSAAVSWWRPLVGGVLGLFTAAVLVPFAVHQLDGRSAAIVIAAFVLPPPIWIVMGLSSRLALDVPDDASAEVDETDAAVPDPGRRRFLLTIAGGVVAVVAGSSLGRYVYDRIWGPTHPDSEVAARPDSPVEWLWCGAVTPTEFTVRARPRSSFDNAVLLVATDPELRDATRQPIDELFDRVARFSVGDLRPDTRYWYGVELDGEVDLARIGTVRTFPDAARPLRLAFGSCARTGSNGAVFDAIRRSEPDVYVNLGDFHYGDVFVDEVDDYREAFDVQLTQPGQAALYEAVPIAYVWDDHDYGPNDSDRRAPGRTSAMVAYREYVPHYELDGPDSAIFQSFTIGTVRVVMTDARSARDARLLDDGSPTIMLGERQLGWLLDELETSAPTHDVVIWVNPVPWVEDVQPGADSWAGFADERALIANHIAGLGIDNLVMVSGDAHMVAIDDGSHTNYSGTPGPGFPLLHVAALDRPGSTKGGPYTLGPIAGGGHFGLVEIDVTPTGVAVGLTAKDWRGDDLLHLDVALPGRAAA